MHQTAAADAATSPPCCDVAEFTRLHYFHGRPLSALDMRREQAYGLEKDRFRNRLLHGWGIACGLEVSVVAAKDCEDERGPVARVECGAAIDCDGREIVVREPFERPLRELLDEHDRRRLCEEPGPVYLTLCYVECQLDRTQPYPASGCEPAPACEYGRVRESFRIRATTHRPDPGPLCEPCCGTCHDACLELAAIADFDPQSETFDPGQLSGTGRRSLTRHVLATVAEVNWDHGDELSRDAATDLFAKGIAVRFSRPVSAASLRGAVELLGVEGGGGRAGDLFTIVGAFAELPDKGWVDHFVYRSTGGERLQYGDRVMITIRGDFIFDQCGRALDGNHIGGRVPSGNGTEGGDFVSWISVADKGGN